MYNIICEMSCQSRFDARYWMLGAGALGQPRGMVWGGRREEGSGWGTHVYLWRIHFDIWQNQYNVVKLKKKKVEKHWINETGSQDYDPRKKPQDIFLKSIPNSIGAIKRQWQCNSPPILSHSEEHNQVLPTQWSFKFPFNPAKIEVEIARQSAQDSEIWSCFQ